MRGRERESTGAAVRGRYERVWPAWEAGAADAGESGAVGARDAGAVDARQAGAFDGGEAGERPPERRDERLWPDLTVFGDPWDVGPDRGDQWPAREDPSRNEDGPPDQTAGAWPGDTGADDERWPSPSRRPDDSRGWPPGGVDDQRALPGVVRGWPWHGDADAAPVSRARRRLASEPLPPRARFLAGPDAMSRPGVWPDDDPGPADPGGPRPPAGAQVLAALIPGRRGLKALAVLAGVVALVAAFVAWQSRPRTVPVSTAASGPATPATAPGPLTPVTPGTPSPAMLVVAVEGRVRHPGLVRLPPGSRVADALAAAGGVLPGTDLSFVNLARKVADGELIVVGITPPPGTQTGAAEPSGVPDGGGIVDLNTATETDLETLPGIGPALAQRIIDYRAQHGGFHSIDELRNVSGIGDAKFAQIKDLVTV